MFIKYKIISNHWFTSNIKGWLFFCIMVSNIFGTRAVCQTDTNNLKPETTNDKVNLKNLVELRDGNEQDFIDTKAIIDSVHRPFTEAYIC